MSQLTDILTALANLTVTVPASIAYNGDKTPQALYLATLPNSAPDAKLPCRLIQLFTEAQGGASGFDIVFGNETLTRVPWRIYDRLLWRKLGQGTGIGSQEADLAKYCAAYVEALKTIPAPTSRAMLKTATLAVREINYPAGSEYWYAGVEVTLDIEERLVGMNPSPWA